MLLRRGLLFVVAAAGVLFLTAALIALFLPARCLGCWWAVQSDAEKFEFADAGLVGKGQVFVSNQTDDTDEEISELVRRAFERVRDAEALGFATSPSAGGVSLLFVGEDHAVEYGTAQFSPLGKPLIVVGPKGRNVDVVAHELTHALQFIDVGFLEFELGLPTWFIEGHAMQVDTRAAYSASGLCALLKTWEPPRLEEMAEPGGFYSGGGNRERVTLHYAYAKGLVREVIEQEGSAIFRDFDGMEELFEKIHVEGFDPCASSPT